MTFHHKSTKSNSFLRFRRYILKCTTLYLFLAFIACTPRYKPYKIIIENDYVEIHFGRMMTKSLLDSISAVLITKGITLSFPIVQYDGEKLSKIEFNINDGIHSGTASTNFVNRIKPFGFKIDRRPNADSAFAVGDLKN